LRTPRNPEQIRRSSLAETIVIETGGEVLPDGTILELIQDPADRSRPALLQWSGGVWSVAREVLIGRSRYIPVEIGASFVQGLPAEPAPYTSTRDLFDDVRSLVARLSGLTDEHCTMLAHFVLASFFVDCMKMAPCLLLYGCSTAEAIALLRVLCDLCRHGILLADSGVRGLPERFRPTRLICQSGTNVVKLLAALRLPGFAISENGRLREISGPTAVYVGEEELRSPFAEDCLWMPVPPARQLLSAQDQQTEAEIVGRLKAQLLRYRLQNLERVKKSTFDAAEFSGSTRELARTFGACVVDAEGLQRQLIVLLTPRDEAMRCERTSKLESVLVESLLACCHRRQESVRVKEIAADVNTSSLGREKFAP
jgi:hypothetical protein